VAGRAFRGLLFDLDETLVPREGAFWSWIERESALRPLRASDRAAIAALDGRGRKPKEALEHLASLFSWPDESLEQRLVRFRNGLLAGIDADPALHGMLERLSRSYRLGIVSNGTGATQRAKIERAGLARFFEPILISEEVGARKPAPQIFMRAAEVWTLPPEAILVVGDDGDHDVAGAHAAGMCAVHVGDGTAGTLSSVLALEAWLRRQQIWNTQS
jgi:putative hydrolase of the HAD superfamily